MSAKPKYVYPWGLTVQSAQGLDGADVRRISLTYVLSETITGGTIEVSSDDLQQIDVHLKEPVEVEQLAQALESLAAGIRESVKP